MDGECEFNSNAPEFVEVIKWEKDGEMYIALINQQENTPVYPIDNIDVILKEKYSTFEILSKTDIKIDISDNDNKSVLRVSNLGIFCMLKLIK